MTIREVAKRAGVSLQTVSNVINGKTSQVGPETRERVLHWIAELGYQPNLHARGLRSQRTYTVGFLTVDPSARFLADPFHTAILSGMADVLRENDYGLLVQALDPAAPAEGFARLFRQRRFDGAVVHLSGQPEARAQAIAQMNDSGCPFVLIEERVTGPRAVSVRADNRHGAIKAVEHLHARGHQRIGFLYYAEPSWPAIEERLGGVEAALRALQLPPAVRLPIDDESFERARVVMETGLRQNPALTAIVCSNDVVAVGALQAAKLAGRKVPGEIAVIGFDDFDFAQYVDPPLTTVALPGYEMGRRAAELLLDHFPKGSFAETDVLFPTTLIARGTA
jgi:DNA-binding LacI/PurR family transcriptional regulator